MLRFPLSDAWVNFDEAYPVAVDSATCIVNIRSRQFRRSKADIPITTMVSLSSHWVIDCDEGFQHSSISPQVARPTCSPEAEFSYPLRADRFAHTRHTSDRLNVLKHTFNRQK